MYGPSQKSLPRLLAWLVLSVLGALLAGLLLPLLLTTHPALPLHLIFAVGFMPLILGAISYFVPVLTRSGTPENRVLLYPLLALLAGILLSIGFVIDYTLYRTAALLALLAIAGLGLWILQRRRQTLGQPHPGLTWYQWALLMLTLALIAIAAGAYLPEQWSALRRLHLHLNLLGFIGLTALGTLRVLLPTAAGYADPDAGSWLKGHGLAVALGSLLMAVGAAWSWPLSLLGAVIWLYPVVRFAQGLVGRHRPHTLTWHGPGIALTLATLGLILLVLTGGLHAVGAMPARPALWGFVLLFLLPLITGATNHLLPLWALGERPHEQQQQARARLGRWSSLRCALFLSAGLMTLTELPGAFLPALLGLLHFIWALVSALVPRR